METETERLKKVHENTSGQPRELFFEQMMHFREIMGSTTYSLKYKEKAFKAVGEAYFRCALTESDKESFMALADEFQRRSTYELLHPRHDALHESKDALNVVSDGVKNE